MQVFASDPCPAESARALDDARVRKMCVETAQILSTAVRELDEEWADEVRLYKRIAQGRALWTWAATERGALLWLSSHGEGLIAELRRRGLCVGKMREPERVIAECAAYARVHCSPGSPGWFVNATRNEKHGVCFKHVPDAHQAYRMYLEARWRIERETYPPHLKPRWTKGEEPRWLMAA